MQTDHLEIRRLFTERTDSYLRFIRTVGYPLALRAFFKTWPGLRSNLRILDAGCGAGVVTLAVHDALVAHGLPIGSLDGFDLTPAMLERFRAVLTKRGITGVRLTEANVMDPHALPPDWNGYDFVVSASMLEYIPREDFPKALALLRGRLRADGTMLLFITRRNWLMKPLIGRWWRGNLYTESELRAAFTEARFSRMAFLRFAPPYWSFGVWGHIVEASQ